LRFDDLEVMADAAAAGMGAALLPCWLIRSQVLAGNLSTVLTDLSGLTFHAYAVWPQTPHLPLKTRAVIDLLAARLPQVME
jgi:DNA-binding transcriptional LysR family regulator